jgi:hypothetical protein
MTISVTNNLTDGTPVDANAVNVNFTDLINATSDGTKNLNIMNATIKGNLIVSGDIYTSQITSYGATSTIIGWSSFSNKYIYYKSIGKTVLVWFYLDGTGSGSIATFTLPVNINANIYTYANFAVGFKTIDNTTMNISYGTLSNPNVFTIRRDVAGNGFTNGVYRLCSGFFFYESV